MGGEDKQNYLFGPRTSGRTKQPGEGEMETGRGKKGKKAGWQLALGLKDAIFAGIGIVGLMMMSFTLGTLAGRGDIYRAAYSWGLLAPETRPAAQAMPQVAPVPATPIAETAAAPAPAAQPPAAAPPPPRRRRRRRLRPPLMPPPRLPPKSPHPAAGSRVHRPAACPGRGLDEQNQGQIRARAQEQKAREDQAHQERQTMARKLTFLNSFDSTPKSGQKKDKTKATAAKSQPTQIKVGTYRDGKTAKAKMAEWQKKGVKVSLKQGKDAKGAYYTLYRQAPAAPRPTPKKAKNWPKKRRSPATPAPAANPEMSKGSPNPNQACGPGKLGYP